MSNPFGWVSEEGDLRVKKSTVIVGKTNNSVVSLGKTLKLVCNVTHDSDAILIIKWLKDEKHISQDEKLLSSITLQQVQLNKYQTEESLTIHNATKRHSGVYSCLAETELDYDQRSWKVKIKLSENYVVVYVSVSICLLTATVTYMIYPYCIQRNK